MSVILNSIQIKSLKDKVDEWLSDSFTCEQAHALSMYFSLCFGKDFLFNKENEQVVLKELLDITKKTDYKLLIKFDPLPSFGRQVSLFNIADKEILTINKAFLEGTWFNAVETKHIIDSELLLKLNPIFAEIWVKFQKKNVFANKKELEVCISKDQGIYRKNKSEYRYTIKGKKRSNLIYHLKNGKLDMSMLKTLQNQKETLIIKEIREINNQFRNKLNTNLDLIIHIDTGGYRLNNEKIDIVFLDR